MNKNKFLLIVAPAIILLSCKKSPNLVDENPVPYPKPVDHGTIRGDKVQQKIGPTGGTIQLPNSFIN